MKDYKKKNTSNKYSYFIFLFFISHNILLSIASENHFTHNIENKNNTFKDDIKSDNCDINYNVISERNANVYNDIYYILQVEYAYFNKKISRGKEEFFLRLLQEDDYNKEIIAASDICVTKKKTEHLSHILRILKELNYYFKNNVTVTQGVEVLEKFINIVVYAVGEEHLTFYRAFRKALYGVTGNAELLKQKENMSFQGGMLSFDTSFLEEKNKNIFLDVIFWVLYSYEKINKVLLHNDDYKVCDEELFCYMYPVYIEVLNNTFREIQLDNSLFKYFAPTLMTVEGFSFLFNQEKYNKFMNEDMAYHSIVNQKIYLMKLLLEKKNLIYLKKISLIMQKIKEASNEVEQVRRGKKEINNILYNLLDIHGQPIEYYLAEHIPVRWIGPLQGVNSKELVFMLTSMEKVYSSSFASQVRQYTNLYSKGGVNDKSVINSWKNNIWLLTLFPPAKFFTCLSDEFPYIAQPPHYYNVQDIFGAHKCLNNPVEAWSDRTYKWENGFFAPVVKLFPKRVVNIASGVVQFGSNLLDVYHYIQSVKSLLNQYQSTKNFYTYFLNLKKLVLYSKELMIVFLALYKENNVPESYMLPEIIYMNKVFSSKDKASVMKKILSWGTSRYNSVKDCIVNFIMPGKMSYFYFNDLKESIEFDILKNFLGAIDVTFTKINLYSAGKTSSHGAVFSIPEVLDPHIHKKASLIIEDMWFPSLRGSPIKNSMTLSDNHRNMMLVSPVAGGKTVLLSTILTALYMANMGIVPAAKLQYTYFVNIVDHMRHDYIIGDGMSQHLAERKSMHMVKNIAKEQKDTQKGIVLIDEIYKGTIPRLAVKEAFLDLPPILTKENIITIITTHFPEIVEITHTPEYFIDLYYLLVNYTGGIFHRTHKLFKDNEDNWWLRNEELGLKYQLSQDVTIE